MTSLPYLTSEIKKLLLTISSLRLCYVHRNEDIEMNDNTAYYGTDEAQYEDINKL